MKVTSVTRPHLSSNESICVSVTKHGYISDTRWNCTMATWCDFVRPNVNHTNITQGGLCMLNKVGTIFVLSLIIATINNLGYFDQLLTNFEEHTQIEL